MLGSPYVWCHGNDRDSIPCPTDGSYWLEVGVSGGIDANPEAMSNTYRWKMRLGRFSPDILMLGDTQRTVVGGDAVNGWTLEIWARPARKAYKTGCNNPSVCGSEAVAESVTYSVAGYLRTLGINQAWPSVDSAELRDDLRGTFISTNGSSQNWTFARDTFKVSAFSPHFLPGGTEKTPGFVKVWLPAAYFLRNRGYPNLASVGADRIDLTRYGQRATATVASWYGGILVDTGVTHFSDPEPTVRVLRADESIAEQNLAVLEKQQSASAGTGNIGNSVKTVVSKGRATIKVTLTVKGTFTVYRKVGKKLTVLKKVSGKKGTNTVVTSYLKGYSFVVKDAKGKTIAVRTTSVRFARFY